MDVEHLVSMANDIAAFFDSEADKAVAAEGVRSHIARYWEEAHARRHHRALAERRLGLTPLHAQP
jgi:formate dehydrogenase subunit delta